MGICINIYGCENQFAYMGCIGIVLIIFIILCISKSQRFVSVILPIFFILGVFASNNCFGENTTLDPIAESGVAVGINGRLVSKEIARDGYNYRLRLISYEMENSPYKIQPLQNIDLRWFCNKELEVGAYISANGYIKYFSTPKNPADFNNKLYFAIRGYNYRFYHIDYKVNFVDYSIFSYLDNVKTAMVKNFDNCLPKDMSALLKSVILGDKSQLSSDVRDSYREIGIYHFLAISGLHISVLATIIFSLLKRVNYCFGSIFLVLFLLGYGSITGFGVSIVRAGIMFTIYILSVPFNKYYDMISSACFTAIIILLFKPLYILDSSFLYSFSAIFGIGFMSDAFKDYELKSRNLISALGAGLATKPVSYFYTYKINLIDVFVNLVLIPLMSLIVMLGFGIAIGCVINMEIGKTIAFLTIPVLKFFGFLCNIAEQISFANLVVGKPKLQEVMIIYMGAVVIYLLLRYKRVVVGISVVLLVIGTCFKIHTKNENIFRTDFLYVGQGDCALAQNEDKAILIDTGGNENNDIGGDVGYYTILPYLNYCGINSIDGVFISHSDTDHLKGLLDIMGKIDIKSIYVSKKMEDNYIYREMLSSARKNNIPVVSLGRGDKLDIGNMDIDVYSPDINREYTSNNGSLVFKLSCNNTQLLFSGEIDTQIEAELLKDYDLRADILKASHHGSKKSNSEELLRCVSPKYIVVSAGENNVYGHPHKEFVDRAEGLNIPFDVTADKGMITVLDDGHKQMIYSYLNDE